MPDLMSGLGKWGKELPKDPSKRTFGQLTRQEDGTFNDDELVKIMTESIEDVAGTVPSTYSGRDLFDVMVLQDHSALETFPKLCGPSKFSA